MSKFGKIIYYKVCANQIDMKEYLLEHDDAADEGDPKSCAPGGGET